MTENNKTNPRVAALKESATLQIADVARKIERQGDQVMKFQTGDPDFDSPKEVVDAAHKALVDGHTHYSDTRGLPELRNALADKLSKDNSIQYDPDREILVTHGASHGIFSCLQTLLQPSDEVLILSPSWMTYASSVTISGGIPVEVPSDPRESFMPNMESLNSLVTTRTKVLIINSPNNPSGFVIPRDLMNLLADFAERHDLTVISDEVYEKLTYDGLKHVSFASLPNMKERTITVNSFSKTYAMSGWRIGYLAGPQEIIKNEFPEVRVFQHSIKGVWVIGVVFNLEIFTNFIHKMVISCCRITCALLLIYVGVGFGLSRILARNLVS